MSSVDPIPGADEICELCGHLFNPHRLLGYIQDNGDPPTKGWMECPVEGCTCKKTWSADLNDPNVPGILKKTFHKVA